MAKKQLKRPLPEVKVGQVWIDNDARQGGKRKVIVKKVVKVKGKAEAYAICLVGWTKIGGVPNEAREVKIKLRRFRPTSTGYRLEGTPPATTPTVPYRWDEVKEARDQGREAVKYTDRAPEDRPPAALSGKLASDLLDRALNPGSDCDA